MASLRHYSEFETNLVSNRKVIEFLLQLKSAKAHGINYIKVKPHLVRHLLRDRLLYVYSNLMQCIVGNHDKGRFTPCDLYHTILLYYYAEAKEIIYESVNLKGVVYNYSHRVNWL